MVKPVPEQPLSLRSCQQQEVSKKHAKKATRMDKKAVSNAAKKQAVDQTCQLLCEVSCRPTSTLPGQVRLNAKNNNKSRNGTPRASSLLMTGRTKIFRY